MKVNVLLFAILFAFCIFPNVFSAYTIVPNGSFETGDGYLWSGITASSTPDSYLSAKDGVYYGYNNLSCFTSTAQNTIATTDAILKAGKTYDFNMWVGISTPDQYGWYCVVVTSGGSVGTCSSGDSSNRVTLYNNSNHVVMTSRAFSLTNTTGGDLPLSITLRRETCSGSYIGQPYILGLDKIMYSEKHDINATLTEPTQPIGINTAFSLQAKFYDYQTGNLLTNSDISATLNFNSEGALAMTYAGNGIWTKSIAGHGRGSYNYTIIASGTGFNTLTTTDSISVDVPLSSLITLTNVENTNFNVDANLVTIRPQVESKQIIFKVDATNTYSLTATPTYKIYNSQMDGKQYFVYTSTNGSSWVFSDSLTFGSGVSNPIQKIWDGNTDQYYYSFTDSVAGAQIKYYKLTYEQIPFAQMNLVTNPNWITIPTPDTYTEGDNKHAYDVFNDSNYTNLQIYSLQKYSELTGGITNKGYELQFTAFADSSPANIQVGFKVGDVNTTTNVAISTTKTRYSVPINTTNYEAQLLIKSSATTSNRIYFSDYAIVPRSYFAGRLEIFNTDGTEPKSILRGSTVTQYLQEGVPFKFTTSAFNKDLDLKTLRIDAMIGTVIIKSYYYNLNGDSPKLINWNEQLAGVIDYNGVSNVNGILTALRTFTLRATLINNADQNVAEQYKTISLLQYPYFPSDIGLNVDLINKKVGSSPSFNFTINQKQADQLIAIDFIIYDSSHTKASPNYSERVFVSQLGCTNNNYCSKQITLDKYQFPEQRSYNVGVELVLKTEPINYTNVLTERFEATSVSYASFETARMLQVFERRDHQYTNTEQIPLVLQIRDDSKKNIKDDFTVYLKVDLKNGASYTELAQQYYPTKVIYSPSEGYNYYYFNNIFFDDSGNLLPDKNSLRFKAYIVPTKQTQASATAYGLTDKCAVYPTDTTLWWEGALDFLGLDTNAIKKSSGIDLFLGCNTKAPNIMTWDDVTAETIDINTSYVPKSSQNQSFLCIRNDSNSLYKNQVGDSLLCAVYYVKSEEQIDNFKITIGNNASDYSVSDSTKQYLQFTIPQSEVMFNDVLMLKSSLEQEFNTDKINTIGQLTGAGFSKLLGNYQTTVDFGQFLTDSGVITNTGFDVNLSDTLNPNVVHGIFFIKIDGLKVVNAYDYQTEYPELSEVPLTKFTQWAQQKNIYLQPKTTNVYVISSDFKTTSAQKVASPLIIWEKATLKNTNADINAVQYETPPARLKFDIFSDMQSANQTKDTRAFFSIWLTYVVPQVFSIAGLMNGVNDFIANPVAGVSNALISNWFLIIILIAFILIVSVIYANFKVGGGNTEIHNHIGRS